MCFKHLKTNCREGEIDISCLRLIILKCTTAYNKEFIVCHNKIEMNNVLDAMCWMLFKEFAWLRKVIYGLYQSNEHNSVYLNCTLMTFVDCYSLLLTTDFEIIETHELPS